MSLSRIHTVSLDRGNPAKPGPTVYRLLAPGVTQGNGTVKLGAVQRSDLLAGRLFLTVHTDAQPAGIVRAPLVVPGAITSASPLPPGVEAISFLGDTLRTLPLSPDTRSRYERQLADARAAYDHTPTNADSIIWLGRRLAYLGRNRDAIDVYTRGIALYPTNPWLYRHRGHRYITVRELDHAIADLERAAALVAGKPDEIEPDGQPNARNMPIGTLHSNIDYTSFVGVGAVGL